MSATSYNWQSSPRKWAFYTENAPHKKIPFDEATCKTIDAAFDRFNETKGRETLDLCGATFNFTKMTYTNQGIMCKLSSCGGIMPYKVAFGKDASGISPASREVLSKLSPASIVTKWYWWDNPSGALPLPAFERDSTAAPTWTSYTPSDEQQLDRLYASNSSNSNFVPLNSAFCVCFNGAHKGCPVMLQSRLDEEANPSIPVEQRRRRPILRASYCWCYNSEFAMGKTNWVPYPPETSALLEQMYIMGFRDAPVTVNGVRYVLNFLAGVHYPGSNTALRSKVARFGTEFVDAVKNRGKIAGDADIKFPHYWQSPSSEKLLCSNAVSEPEKRRIAKMIGNSTKCKKINIYVC